MDILIGTRNPYKATEMIRFLEGIEGINIHNLDELAERIIIEEDQNSLLGNARKKAMEISKHTCWYVLTSDGGVDIPGLGNKWDRLKNQRTVGENKTDREKVETLLKLMAGLKGDNRKCSYCLAIALAKDNKLLWSFEDVTENGYIVEYSQDTAIPSGRWMGHIWYYPHFKKTFNQTTEVEKNEIRKMAGNLKEKLQKYLREIA